MKCDDGLVLETQEELLRLRMKKTEGSDAKMGREHEQALRGLEEKCLLGTLGKDVQPH